MGLFMGITHGVGRVPQDTWRVRRFAPGGFAIGTAEGSFPKIG
jgi:hypothetical protein